MDKYYKLEIIIYTSRRNGRFMEYFNSMKELTEFMDDIVERYEELDSYEGYDEKVISLTDEQIRNEVTFNKYLALNPKAKEIFSGVI